MWALVRVTARRSTCEPGCVAGAGGTIRCGAGRTSWRRGRRSSSPCCCWSPRPWPEYSPASGPTTTLRRSRRGSRPNAIGCGPRSSGACRRRCPRWRAAAGRRSGRPCAGRRPANRRARPPPGCRRAHARATGGGVVRRARPQRRAAAEQHDGVAADPHHGGVRGRGHGRHGSARARPGPPAWRCAAGWANGSGNGRARNRSGAGAGPPEAPGRGWRPSGRPRTV